MSADPISNEREERRKGGEENKDVGGEREREGGRGENGERDVMGSCLRM